MKLQENGWLGREMEKDGHWDARKMDRKQSENAEAGCRPAWYIAANGFIPFPCAIAGPDPASRDGGVCSRRGPVAMPEGRAGFVKF